VAQPEPAAQDVVRLPLDLRAERAIARLRASAALIVVLASGWLLALPYPLPRLFALAGFGFALLWLVRAARTRRQIRGAADHYLELDREALRLREGERSERVPWSEVDSIAVDEDRLLLRVARRGGPPLEIEPRYGRMGLYELFEAIRGARARAADGGGCAPAADG
jgi:hypothetical protein